MNARKFVVLTLLMLPLAVLGSASTALAQGAVSSGASIQPYVIETTFPFQAGGRILPAGKYVIEQPASDRLIVRSADGLAADVVILTRLAQPTPPLTDARVTFDRLNDMYYASEIWIPGQDGFLLNDSMVKMHTHVTIKATTR